MNLLLRSSLPADLVDSGWRRLRLLNYYRSTLALFFIVIYFNGWAFEIFHGQGYDASLFEIASLGYFICSLIFIVSIAQRKPEIDLQITLQTCVDIIAIIALMHASGGVRSGLGMLLVINISLTSLFLPLRVTLTFAALASLSILGEQLYSQLIQPTYTPSFPQAGILGMLFFAFAALTSNIARRLHESELLASQKSRELESAIQMNEHVIRNMRTGIFVVDSEGQIQMANNAAASLLGNIYIEASMPLSKISPVVFERFKLWQSGEDISLQKPLPQSHGLPDLQAGFSIIEPERGTRSRTLIFLEDATQLNQRFQQVKLASLGRLTASIAHEIRNPLAAINHAAQLLEETHQGTPDEKLTQIINTQVLRLNGIIENVLNLSRQQRGAPEVIDLKIWLKGFRDEFCSSQQLPQEQIEISIEPADTKISFDPNHLHQVMWNLCSNAISHYQQNVRSLHIHLQGGYTTESNRPFLDVIDNGAGISPEAEQHIFEPFFTTSSDGTGLGLYITKEVVESNRAKIRHLALPTEGTCFRLQFLPADALHNVHTNPMLAS
jgi:two-component system sensor histidine kinase PilS (NtrC family)